MYLIDEIKYLFTLNVTAKILLFSLNYGTHMSENTIILRLYAVTVQIT